MHKVKDQQKAALSIMSALQYNAARQKRSRMVEAGEEGLDGCPTPKDIKYLRERMYKLTKHRADCPEKQHHLEVARQEKRLDALQD